RRHGKSNYGIFDRGLQGVLDLAGVWWLRRRRRRMPKTEEIRRA
ncbi:MAG: dolichol-phosphate mannosyltransferase, partial [Mesorhizobium sp.]